MRIFQLHVTVKYWHGILLYYRFWHVKVQDWKQKNHIAAVGAPWDNPKLCVTSVGFKQFMSNLSRLCIVEMTHVPWGHLLQYFLFWINFLSDIKSVLLLRIPRVSKGRDSLLYLFAILNCILHSYLLFLLSFGRRLPSNERKWRFSHHDK